MKTAPKNRYFSNRLASIIVLGSCLVWTPFISSRHQHCSCDDGEKHRLRIKINNEPAQKDKSSLSSFFLLSFGEHHNNLSLSPEMAEVNQSSSSLIPLCPHPSTLLQGRLNVTFYDADSSTIKPNSKPQHCKSRYGRVAIIIPFREREIQLKAQLRHLHQILQRQQLNYVIIAVEQAGNDTFNKGMLMNIGYKESQRLVDPYDDDTKFTCYIFHDVDLLTEDDRGLYTCRDLPVHMSEFVDKYKYKNHYGMRVLFGGVCSVPKHQFEFVNGYSNVYFGWGGEDDDMTQRFQHHGIRIYRVATKDFYRFKMFPHHQDTFNVKNKLRFRLLANTAPRMFYDGLNTLTYQLVSRTFHETHLHLLARFSKEEILNSVFRKMKLHG